MQKTMKFCYRRLTVLDFLNDLFFLHLSIGFVQAKAVGAVLYKGSLGWCGRGAASIGGGEKDKEGSKLDLHNDVWWLERLDTGVSEQR